VDVASSFQGFWEQMRKTERLKGHAAAYRSIGEHRGVLAEFASVGDARRSARMTDRNVKVRDEQPQSSAPDSNRIGS
jgi:hypothetical protein